MALAKPATSLNDISGTVLTIHYLIASFRALFSSSPFLSPPAFPEPPALSGTFYYLAFFKSPQCVIYYSTFFFKSYARDYTLSYDNHFNIQSHPLLYY